jgi:Imm-5 like putative immunity protein
LSTHKSGDVKTDESENPMGKSKFSIAHKDAATLELMGKTDHKTLAVWTKDCAERVLPYFEGKYPDDQRPRQALEALQAWIDTGVFRMADIRKASLTAHAAAREVGAECPARSAARAAAQAVATAHVPTHSLGAANYALQAIHRATSASEADAAVARERSWQYQHLRELTDH